MREFVNWVMLRLAFVVGFALFVLAMFDVLPGIFLLIGFELYCIPVPFWFYPKDRLQPSDEDIAIVSILLGTRTGQAPLPKSRKAELTPGSLPTSIIPSPWLSSSHLPHHKA